jgi:hypothetical protein
MALRIRVITLPRCTLRCKLRIVPRVALVRAWSNRARCLASRVSLEFSRMRCVYPPGGIHESLLGLPSLPSRVAVRPFCGVWPDRLRHRHVIFDNSLADGSWYYSRGHVVGPSELDVVDGKLPVDGSHYLTPPNALRLNWRSATGGDWSVTLDVRGRYRRVKFAGSALRMWC